MDRTAQSKPAQKGERGTGCKHGGTDAKELLGRDLWGKRVERAAHVEPGENVSQKPRRKRIIKSRRYPERLTRQVRPRWAPPASYVTLREILHRSVPVSLMKQI